MVMATHSRLNKFQKFIILLFFIIAVCSFMKDEIQAKIKVPKINKGVTFVYDSDQIVKDNVKADLQSFCKKVHDNSKIQVYVFFIPQFGHYSDLDDFSENVERKIDNVNHDITLLVFMSQDDLTIKLKGDNDLQYQLWLIMNEYNSQVKDNPANMYNMVKEMVRKICANKAIEIEGIYPIPEGTWDDYSPDVMATAQIMILVLGTILGTTIAILFTLERIKEALEEILEMLREDDEEEDDDN